MRFEIFNKEKKYPFLVVDEWFSDKELSAVWSELNFYLHQPEIQRAETTLTATDNRGNALSKSFRFYIDGYYSLPKVSHLLRYKNKFDDLELKKHISEIKPYGRSFITSNFKNTLLSYYEENDKYESHHDITQWTCLIWMVKEPIAFTGGDFYFTEINEGIKLKNNRAVFFPSCYLHGVTPVIFKDKDNLNKGLGRFTITTFFDIDVNKGFAESE